MHINGYNLTLITAYPLKDEVQCRTFKTTQSAVKAVKKMVAKEGNNFEVEIEFQSLADENEYSYLPMKAKLFLEMFG